MGLSNILRPSENVPPLYLLFICEEMLPRLPRKIVINWSSTPFHRKCVPYYSVIEIAPFWMSQRASDNSPMLAALSSARRGSALLVFASLSLWKVTFFLSFIAFLLLPSLPAENFLWKAPATLVNCFFCVLLKDYFHPKRSWKVNFTDGSLPDKPAVCCALRCLCTPTVLRLWAADEYMAQSAAHWHKISCLQWRSNWFHRCFPRREYSLNVCTSGRGSNANQRRHSSRLACLVVALKKKKKK